MKKTDIIMNCRSFIIALIPYPAIPGCAVAHTETSNRVVAEYRKERTPADGYDQYTKVYISLGESRLVTGEKRLIVSDCSPLWSL